MVSQLGGVNREPHTVTMDNKIYPAAVASMDATPLYIRLLIDDVEPTSPTAR